MIRQSIHLSKKHRLDQKEEFILPSPQSVLRSRSGSKISRVFTHIFSHKSLRKLLGVNMAFAIVAAGFAPVKATLTEAELVVIAQQNVLTQTEKGIQYPLEKIQVNQGYRYFHPGIDFEGNTGDPVKPIMAGKVQGVQYSRFAYGNAVIIGHGSGLTSLYAHLSKIDIKEGDEVTKSTTIGKVGSTGRSTGDHLHLEVRQNGQPINPHTVLPR